MQADSSADAVPLQSKTVLVLGGARSGKSAYAQTLAEHSGRAPVYLATATAWDAEMHERIAAHQSLRDERWRTVDAPINLPEALAEASAPGAIVVVDCLTLWLTNLMLGEHDVAVATTRLCAALDRPRGPVVLVSNEVGLGIVPDTPLGRRFRDAQGRLNQAVAAVADTVVFVAAGLPVLLKPSGFRPLLL